MRSQPGSAPSSHGQTARGRAQRGVLVVLAVGVLVVLASAASMTWQRPGSGPAAPALAHGARAGDSTPPEQAGSASRTGAAGGLLAASAAGDGAAWREWRVDGSLTLVWLYAARGRVVTVLGDSRGGAVARTAAVTGPLSLVVRGVGDAAAVRRELEDAKASTARAWETHNGSASTTVGAMLSRTLDVSVTDAGVALSGSMPQFTPCAGMAAAEKHKLHIGDTDVFVVDAAAMPSPTDLRGALRGFGPRAALHVVVIGLGCSDADAEAWRAVDALVDDCAVPPSRIERIDRARRPPARRLAAERGPVLHRTDFLCRPATARAHGPVVGASATATSGVAVLSRRPLWPSLAHGWRHVVFADNGLMGLPSTLSPADVLVALLEPPEGAALRNRSFYRVPRSCVARALSTPWQRVAATPSPTAPDAPPVLSVSPVLDKLPPDGGGGAPLSDVLAAIGEYVNVDAVSKGSGDEADQWRVAATKFAYLGRFCGETSLSVRFTVDDPMFQPIAQPLVEALWEAGVPTTLLLQPYVELPGLHVMTFLSDAVPRRYIAWQMEYQEERVTGSTMELYLRRSLGVWEYARYNIPLLAQHGWAADDVQWVFPCYHPSLTHPLPAEMREARADVVFMGSMAWNVPRRQRSIEILRGAGGKWLLGHLKIGGEFAAFAAKGNVSLNIHAFDNAELELTRLIPLLANGRLVVSEEGRVSCAANGLAFDALLTTFVSRRVHQDAAINEILRPGVVLEGTGDLWKLDESLRAWSAKPEAERAAVAKRGLDIIEQHYHCDTNVATVLPMLRRLLPSWLPVPFFPVD